MNQRLTVQVDADIKNLERGLQRGEKSVNRFGNEVNRGEKQVGKFGKTTKTNAVPAMTSFSQVIQDSPYGIRGVANNLQQLTSQMGYLATSAGGVGGAMKALVGSLIGPAGILLAVSVVTSLLVAYGDKLEFVASQAEKLAEATKKYVGEAKAEISQLKILVGIADDAANSTDVRRAALEKINDKYGKYLGNLDLERLKTDQVRTAIDNLTRSLITQAKIKGIEDMITEKTTETAEESISLDLQKAKSVKTLTREMSKLKEGNAFWGRIIRQGEDLNEQIALLRKSDPDLSSPELTNLKSALGNYTDLNKKIKEVEESTNKAIEPLVKLQSKFEKDVLGFEVTPTFSQDEVMIEGGEKPKVKVQPEVDKAAITELNRQIAEAQAESDFLDQELSFIMPLENALGEAGYADNLNAAWQTLETQFDEHLSRMDAKTKEFAGKQQMYGQIMAQGFLAFGDAIGEALDGSDDAFADFVRSFLKSASKMILGLIAQSLGNAILGATQTATATGPAAAITLPGFMAASIGVVQGAVGGIPSFNDGGMVGGGMPTGDKILARLNSGEMVLNQSQQSSLFRLLDSGVRAGGSQPLEIVGESRISGDTIITAYRRAETMNKRIN